MAKPKAGGGVGDGVGVGLGVAALACTANQKPASCEIEPPLCGPPAAAWPMVPSILLLPSMLAPPPLATTDEVMEYLSPLLTCALTPADKNIAVAITVMIADGPPATFRIDR